MIEEIRLIYEEMTEKAKYYTRVGFLSTALLLAANPCIGQGIKNNDLVQKLGGATGILFGIAGLVYAANGRISEDRKKLRQEIYGAQN